MTLSARLTLRSLALPMGLILTLAACGSDDLVAETTAPANEPAPADTAADTAPASSDAAAGPGVTTITMSDGTVYAIELSSCDTTSTDSAFLLPDSYDLTVDGANVSGTFSLRAIGPTRPHGDQIGVTVDVRC